VLIGLLILALTGGSAGTLALTEWLDGGAQYAKQEIADPVLRRDVLATIERMKDRRKDLHEMEEKAAKSIDKLAGSRQSRAADFQSALTGYRAETDALQEQLLDLRFQLKAQVTREQWAAAHGQFK